MRNRRDCQIQYISVVIPVYNEIGCLAELIDRTIKSCEQTRRKYEIIFIDDGSHDGSTEALIEAANANPDRVVACILNRNYGQHSAIMAGFAQVRGDLVITLDADLQNPPEEIPNLLKAAEEGNDVVGTIRQNRQDTLFRRWASKVVNLVAQKATGVNMHDYGCMLRAYRRHIVDAMLQCPERSTFIPVLANSFARTTCEIPVRHCERAVGESKYSLIKLINLQFNLLTCMTTFPLRLLSYVGVFMALFGVLFGVLLFVLRFWYGAEWAANGVFTLFAPMFLFFGCMMVGMGLQGEYLARVYNDVRSRPRYFIEEVVGRRDEQ
ncbi:glycosyltransferase [Victivallis sp. Marseille-Q1083]|uniref:glycosyltransferase n=1 Tax=Victivallis sp. Marseille-Q1083 TaxID=2717288 RepID=UPI0015896EB5|nr:glycosyltransferase [Victivallis sp. Marseille-Q1083]